jgi:hypothetical protein
MFGFGTLLALFVGKDYLNRCESQIQKTIREEM